MKKNVKVFVGIGAAAAAAVVILIVVLGNAGGNLDVVGKESVSSFDTILKTIPDKVAADETNVGWALTAPDKSVRFILSEDYSKSPLHDVMLEFDAQPFIDAGLDLEKLPDSYVFYESGMGGADGTSGANGADDTSGADGTSGADSAGGKMLMVGTKLGNDSLTYSGAPTALAAYEQIVGKYRDSINYHTALDHYGVKLGDGNMFEWAKDLSQNSTTNEAQDKDIVFVLNPEPLIAAGVDPEKIEGWVYAEVPVEENGKTTEVWKFLKPFDLK